MVGTARAKFTDLMTRLSNRGGVGRALVLLGSFIATGLVLATFHVGNAEAKRRSYTIRTDDGWVKRIGPFRPQSSGTPGHAKAVFGTPSSVSSEGNVCHIEWRRLRFRTVFANFGLGSACTLGSLQSATIRSSQFRTRRGIRVGSRSSAIPGRHRNAEFRGSSWWIASVHLPYGVGREQPTIRALVRNGRVYALKLWVGAAGE